jgi:hypothetical protein
MSHFSVSARRSLLLLALLGMGLVNSGCQRRSPGKQLLIRRPVAGGAVLHGTPLLPIPVDARYKSFVIPFILRHGCASGNCHGMFRGGGLSFSDALSDTALDVKTIAQRLDRRNPEKSELVQKITNKVPHNGGINVREGSCEYQRLLAWIAQRPDPVCADPPPPDQRERFAREVVPALHAMGCATGSCHGSSDASSKARLGLDLSSLTATPAQPERAYLMLERQNPNHLYVFRSPVIRAADAVDGKHQVAIDKWGCAYRRLYGYIGGNPESTCALPGAAASPGAQPLPKLSLADLGQVVMPAMERRGCTNATCHGGGAGDMMLTTSGPGAEGLIQIYLALTSRVEDFAHIDDSTLLRTARNQEPHGGGKRLGRKGDCIDGIIRGWLLGQPVHACPPAEPPSYERYVSEIQPVIDKMTCSNPKCHGGSIDLFTVMPHPTDPKVLMANYQEIIKHIDYDFMPLSGIQLRMREPCAYAVVGSWIEKLPKPDCVVHDPDPSIFPRRDPNGNAMHAKVAPDSPPALPAKKP